MITMDGKYNSANIMVDELDDTTKEQIQTFLNHPAFANSYIAIMVDCHKGNGSCIGFTMTLNDYIIPNVIGVDINCGMATTIYDIDPTQVNLPSLDRYIKEKIPSGFSIRNNELPCGNIVFLDKLATTCGLIKGDMKKTLRSIGSLGGGNHFIEAGVNNAGKFCITVHTGSRNFGKCVAEYFQKRAVEQLQKFLVSDIDKELAYIPIGTALYNDYVFAMEVAQQLAVYNRQAISSLLHEALLYYFPGVVGSDYIECAHNFIDFDDKIIRKGATPAHAGQRVIIPFNMRDGIAIGIGKDCKKYNFSAPHGAGRIYSRTKAKALLDVGEFQKQMADAGIYTTTANESTLDEAPGAYKDKQLILDNIAETVDIVDFIKPIYNFKAEEKERHWK
jgi:tRNA-splicing ligase RtcB